MKPPRGRRPTTAELEDKVLRYLPRGIDTRRWFEIRDFVQEAVLAVCPALRGFDETLRILNVFTRLTLFGVDDGLALDRELLLDPAIVERFIATRSKTTASQERGMLRLLGKSTTRTTPWEPKAREIYRIRAADPYTAAEESQLLLVAQHQSTERRQRQARTVFHLALGAGLHGDAIPWAQAQDLIERPEALVIQVRRRDDDTVLEVPVRAAHEDAIRELASGLEPQEFLAGGWKVVKNGITYLHSQLDRTPAGVPRLSARRLRLSWMVAQLRAKNRPDLIQRFADLKYQYFMFELMRHLGEPSPEELRRSFRNA